MITGKTWQGSALLGLYTLLALAAIAACIVRAEGPTTKASEDEYKPKTNPALRRVEAA